MPSPTNELKDFIRDYKRESLLRDEHNKLQQEQDLKLTKWKKKH